MRLRLAYVLFAVWPCVASADEGFGLATGYLETPELRLMWADVLQYLAPHVIRTYQSSLDWQKRVLGWEPSERTTVLLRDTSDVGNAYAVPAPHNLLVYDVSPLPHDFETFPASDRFYTLMNHELVHVAQGDMSNSEDRNWRRFFLGKVGVQVNHPETLLYSFLTVPRNMAPRWYHEGTAVFVETWKSGGLGRAQGGYDEMVFRAMVRDGARFYDPLGLESRGVRVDFQVGANAYLYGTRFVTWLAFAYSPQKVIDWMRRDEGTPRSYAAQFERVFGKSLDEAWREWVAFEHDFQRANLAEVRKYPVTPHRKLVDRALGNVSRAFFDEATQTLYAGIRTPGTVDYIGALDTRNGTIRRLADIKRAMLYKVTSFAFDPGSGTAFYTADNYAYRDLMAVDVRTGESRMLMEDARIGNIAFNAADRSLLGVRHIDGLAALVVVPYPYDEWKRLHLFPYGTVPYDLDISPDGKLLSASVAELDGEQYLRVFSIDRLLQGDARPISEYKFGQSVPEGFVFSRDGKYLYGSSYYTGVSNIFRYEVATGDVVAVSNTDSDFFNPFPLSDGRLLVLTYTSSGFVPAIIDPVVVKDASSIRFLGTELTKKHPIVTEWQVEPPSKIDDAKLVQHRAEYRSYKHVALNNAFPVLEGYKNHVGFGYTFNFADPMSYAALSLTAVYTPSTDLPGNERAHLGLDAYYLGWWGSLSWNRSDFYDLFGPVKRSRKGFAAKGGYDYFLIYDEPRKLELVTELAYYDKIDVLPGAQNVAATGFDQLVEGEVGLRYWDTRRSLGALDDEKGIHWTAFGGFSRVPGSSAQWLRGNLDYGWDLPLRNSSIWLRTAGGYMYGNPDLSISNFYLGGFRNNYVDRRDIQRYRDWQSYPGFGIDEISGQSFLRPMIEWNVTPYVFESVGVPRFHLAWLRPAVFASMLWTDVTNSARRTQYANVGTQFDLRFSTMHWYDMTLSIGYAVGFREGRRAGDELMISLKIL